MTAIIRVSGNDSGVIRDLVINLIDSSRNIDEPVSVNNLKKICDDERSYLFAAILDDTTVGYALAYRFPSLYEEGSLAYLYDIEVLKDHRRKGLGKLLVTSMLAALKLDGVKELWLGTATDNIEGQALFSSTGAEQSGETFNDYTYNLI